MVDLVVRAAGAIEREERIAAFGQLVESFRDMACGYAYALLGDFHLAEDAAQEAFVTAYRSLGQLRDPAAFPGWFRRIVWSACGRIRPDERATVASLDAVGAGVLAAADSLPTAAGDEPAQAAEANELRDAVLHAVAQLPPPQREVTTLFYINGYSQKDIAQFLEVPVGTVKNRLHASRGRLKERMLHMVKDTLHQNAPGERFDRRVIDELLSRPRPLEIPGHPVRDAWEAVRQALADYEVVTGPEVEDRQTAKASQDHAWEEYAYRLGEGRALRFQMTSVTMAAVVGRSAPVRLLAAGRVFRPDREDATHTKVFHQMEGLCIQTGADAEAFLATCERCIRAVVPDAEVRWVPHDYGYRFVAEGHEAMVSRDGREQQALGGGTLSQQALRDAGFDPAAVSGFAWGLSLERLAMLRLGIDDIHALWQPPYVT